MRFRAALLALVLGSTFVATAAGPAQAKTRTDRVIEDGRITESSGLAASLRHRRVLWTHNDSGGGNQIFAIAGNGSTAATVTIAGEDARDWEAITSLRGPENGPAAGQALIAVADIGDNDAKHESVRIAIVEEPQNLTDVTLDPVRVLRLTYPGGPRDAEAVLADPRSGRLYVVSKTLFGAELFAVPKQVWPGNQATGVSDVTQMTKVAQIGAAMITDGAFLPNGTMALRSYGNLTLVAAPETAENGRLETLASKALPDQEQGESLAVVEDGGYALIGSEGTDSPILRVRIPKPAAAQPQAPSPSAGRTATKTAERLQNLAGDDTRRELLLGAGGAAIALVMMFAAAILLRPKRSRRRRR